MDRAEFARPGYHRDNLEKMEQFGGVWHRKTFKQPEISYGLRFLRVHLQVQEQDKLSIQNTVSLGDVRVMKDTLEDFGHMLDSGDNADVHLVCGDASFPCHKMLLAARSLVFKAMFFGQGDYKEGKKGGRVVIKEFEPAEVKQFLRFIYSGKCDFNKVDPWQVLALADKYDVKMLNQICCEVIKVNVKNA